MSDTKLSFAQGWRYGLPGLPLAFVALPLYVHLPHHYAALGVPLAVLGSVLLLARAFDAATDPLIGRWLDAIFRLGPAAVVQRAWLLALVLWLALLGLFYPPPSLHAYLPIWAWTLLITATLAYSALAIAHQSWGARLGGGATRQARVVAWREGWTLSGVVSASVLPALAGWAVTLSVLAAALFAALLAWPRGPQPSAPIATVANMSWQKALRWPWQHQSFRRLMAVFVLNGLASAMPATLVLFFIADRLQASDWEPLFLASYFASAAAGMPLWLAIVRRLGLARAWLLGMVLSIAVFLGTAWLGAGDAGPYLLVCVLSGVALGADLALPAALLAVVIDTAGDRHRNESVYFGWWNLASKANLALAAGVALPVLSALGYTPGQTDPAGLRALTVAYAVLPCVLKACAAFLLWRGFVRAMPRAAEARARSPAPSPPPHP